MKTAHVEFSSVNSQGIACLRTQRVLNTRTEPQEGYGLA